MNGPDNFWLAAAKFLADNCIRPERIIAPAGFERCLGGVNSYNMKDDCVSPDALVIHKGLLHELDCEWINNARANLHPAFANEVFVIYTKQKISLPHSSKKHLTALLDNLSQIGKAKPMSSALRQSTRMIAYLGDYKALTTTIYGHKVYVDTRDMSLAPHILLDGYWEQWITNVFRSQIKPGMKVVDIGANIGWYSLLAADLIGSEGELHAFEANPEMADLTYRNIMINGFLDRVNVINKAVYRETTILEFKVFEKYMGSSGIFVDKKTAASFNDAVKSLSVDAVSLDDHFAAGTKIDYIKIDAEGAEPYILQGARRLLAENPRITIMMEFAPSIIATSYGSAEKFVGEIKSLGFEIWRISTDSTLHSSSLGDLLSVSHCDIILKR